MKNPSRSALLATLLALAATLPAAAQAGPDTAAQLLARQGHVAITNVGKFVEPGTFRIQVAAKLGQPDARLADDTWLYHHRRIAGSDAEGTLVVRFAAGRVHTLSLATPAVVAAWRQEAAKTTSSDLLAKK